MRLAVAGFGLFLASIARGAEPVNPFVPSQGPGEQPVAMSPGAVIEHFLYSIETSSSPCVIWVDPAIQATEPEPYTAGPTWRSQAVALRESFGPFQLRTHPDFEELAWGTPSRISLLCRRMGEEVPPVLIVGGSARDFPRMWQAVSGTSIRVSPGLVSSPTHLSPARGLDLARLFQDFEFVEELTHEPDPLPAVFVTTGTLVTNVFMARLAAQVGCSGFPSKDGWEFRPLVIDDTTRHLIRDTLAELEETYDGHEYNAPSQTFLRMGPIVAPFLIRQLDRYEDYTYCSLLRILAHFPSPERNAAFLRELDRWKTRPRAFLSNWFLETIMTTLADDDVRAAIPLLQEYARQAPEDPEAAGWACIALDRLEAPLPPGRPAPPVQFPPEAPSGESAALYQPVADALLALADRSLLDTSGTLRVVTVTPNEMGGLTFRGDFVSSTGQWELDTGRIQGNLFPFGYHYIRGPVWGGGYAGVLENKNGYWTVRFWRQLWIS